MRSIFLPHPLCFKESFSQFSFLICFVLPFKKPTVLDVKLGVLSITCESTGPQECRHSILCQGRREVRKLEQLSLKSAGMVLVPDSDSKYFRW